MAAPEVPVVAVQIEVVPVGLDRAEVLPRTLR